MVMFAVSWKGPFWYLANIGCGFKGLLKKVGYFSIMIVVSGKGPFWYLQI